MMNHHKGTECVQKAWPFCSGHPSPIRCDRCPGGSDEAVLARRRESQKPL